MENFSNSVILVSSLYFLLFSLWSKTKNTRSFFVFRFIPAVLSISSVIIFLYRIGFIIK